MDNKQTQLPKIKKDGRGRPAGHAPSKLPTPKEDLLPVDWKDKVLNWFCEGWSRKEILRELCLENPEKKFHIQTWYVLEKRDKEFGEIVAIGEQMSQGWWEKVGRKCLIQRDFNTGLWYANMKNRFGWRDKHDVEHSGDVNLKMIIDQTNDNFKRQKFITINPN